MYAKNRRYKYHSNWEIQYKLLSNDELGYDYNN